MRAAFSGEVRRLVRIWSVTGGHTPTAPGSLGIGALPRPSAIPSTDKAQTSPFAVVESALYRFGRPRLALECRQVDLHHRPRLRTSARDHPVAATPPGRRRRQLGTLRARRAGQKWRRLASVSPPIRPERSRSTVSSRAGSVLTGLMSALCYAAGPMPGHLPPDLARLILVAVKQYGTAGCVKPCPFCQESSHGDRKRWSTVSRSWQRGHRLERPDAEDLACPGSFRQAVLLQGGSDCAGLPVLLCGPVPKAFAVKVTLDARGGAPLC